MRDNRVIAAISTPPGLGGICIVRVSGEGALALGDALLPPSLPKASARPAGTFFYAPVFHPLSREKIDDALYLVFRAPHSYTGEEALEIQGHGGRLPSRRLLEAVLAAGARLAEPGEFTERAFLNGRMDLTRAEAVCDFIHAKSERAAQLARAQLDGSLGSQVSAAYSRLLAVNADIEHTLDFDESELPAGFVAQTDARIAEAAADLQKLISTRHEGQMLREGALVVISGKPNAGKSSLMNALLRQNRAIVNAAPGTTRDIIEEPYELDGIPLRLVDTAGLRDTANEVEAEGISRARSWIEQADLNLHLVDSTVPCDASDIPAFPNALVLFTKCDLPHPDRPGLQISAKTGEGLDALKAKMLAMLGVAQGNGLPPPSVSLRHAEELRLALDNCAEARSALSRGPDGLVIAAVHLRNACEAVGRITGRVYTDDLLDRIFSHFCVGK